MGLIDKLRQAQEHGRDAAHRGLERARDSWDDAERRLRRKMRLHPRRASEAPLPMRDAGSHASSEAENDATLAKQASAKGAA